MKKSLLIISCSGGKTKTPGAIPAYQRYNGQFYKIIDKAKREGYFPTGKLDIVIISGKLGFLKWDDKIEDYEKEMTVQQANALRSSVQTDLQAYLHGKDYVKVFINLGAKYRMILDGFNWNDHFSEVVEAKGRIGEKQSQLKKCLQNLC